MIRVLMPDARRWPPLETAVAKRLGQAKRMPLRANAWLAETFGLSPDAPWPAALLTRSVDASAPENPGRTWLRADPAWINADINGGKLLGVGETLPMTAEDVHAFLPVLQPVFAEAGMQLDAPNPHRWYLEIAHDASLPEFHGPAQALGDDAFEHLAFEGSHRRWKTLMSEAQILLHQHPHNAVRASRGLPPVNSLWFWGQGSLPAKRSVNLGTVHTRDAMLAGLAQHHGLKTVELREVPSSFEAGDLIDLRGFPIAQILPAFAALSCSAGTEWLFEDFDALVWDRLQTFRFWRKPLQPGGIT